eukprot:192210_1
MENKQQVHYDEKKTHYDSEEDEDIAEVCVTGGDKRREIYNTKYKNDIIIKCIGQLLINYAGVGGGYSIGTGTIFHVEGNKSFVLTCAHNIYTKLWLCTTSQC